MDNLMSSQARQSMKLKNRLKLEKPNVSYANLHSEIMKNVENFSPESSVNHQKQQDRGMAIANEELVKYMSNVPSYLEKGINLKEKALNVGVIDWRRLEKWQYNHKPIPHQSSRCSPSSSTSSLFSTDESSTRSGREHSSSPARQRMHRQSLQSHLNASTEEGYSQGSQTVTENVGKFEDLKAASSNPVKGPQSIFRMYQSLSRNQSEVKLKECKRKDVEPQIIPKVETSLDFKRNGVASRSKGKTKIQDSESTDVFHNVHERCKAVQPRDDPESSHSAEARRRSISEGAFPGVLYSADRYSDAPHLCPLPCEDDNTDDSWIKQPRSVDGKSIKISSGPSQPSPCTAKMSSRPSRSKSLEEKSNTTLRNSNAIESSEGSDLKKGTVEASKLRNSSPTRRFINGLGRIGRISSSKDGSEYVTHGSDKHVASSSLEDLGNNKADGTRRSESSPLRRLLNPLLKPKAEPSEKDSTSGNKACKSSNGRVESSTVHPAKVKLNFSSCKIVNVDDSHHNKKQGSSTVQALLQIVIKNGLPLFTFAIDNNNDILAATMRKDEKCWIYTFFTVHELKKKNGWINQGCKGNSCGYVPNAVAQMMVSVFPNLVRDHSPDELTIREFVLFAVDLKKADQQTSNFQPNDELAAIVIKVPKDTPTSLNKDRKQSNNLADPSVIGLGDSLLEGRKYPNSTQNGENRPAVQSQELPSATVILPGGVHGMPSLGEPSPLIRRWKSGGLCDCGGWDLGCRLTVLANQTKLGRRSSSAKTHNAAERFELFSQREDVDDTPVFSLSPFKDGIFSVEFNSSLSFLQAFSICMAVLHSRKPYELLELSKLFEEKSSEETAAAVTDEKKAPNEVQEEVPESYASYPPVSPIGRV